jgi:SAM-dependent methyltransferase
MSPSNLEILAYDDTPPGALCLRRREPLSLPGTVVTEVTLCHEFLMSSYNTASERALADVALEMHAGEELKVLVGGLGLGYTARAALESSRVGRVEVVEFLPQVIDWLEQELVPLSAELKADERFEAVRGDVYARLGGPVSDRFDLILIDVDHAPDDRFADASGSFYTEEGLRRAARHLAPGGVLVVLRRELALLPRAPNGVRRGADRARNVFQRPGRRGDHGLALLRAVAERAARISIGDATARLRVHLLQRVSGPRRDPKNPNPGDRDKRERPHNGSRARAGNAALRGRSRIQARLPIRRLRLPRRPAPLSRLNTLAVRHASEAMPSRRFP